MTELETRLGLMLLSLIRQLPPDNKVRKQAVNLVVSSGFCDLDHIMRNDVYEKTIPHDDGKRRCEKCDGIMHHERLRGWVCGACR